MSWIQKWGRKRRDCWFPLGVANFKLVLRERSYQYPLSCCLYHCLWDSLKLCCILFAYPLIFSCPWQICNPYVTMAILALYITIFGPGINLRPLGLNGCIVNRTLEPYNLMQGLLRLVPIMFVLLEPLLNLVPIVHCNNYSTVIFACK